MRATDFVTSFQKCKLSFNLLAYLENYLQEPSADELLHHIFPPLAFLVDECYDLFGEDLVRDILNPLLTGAAVAMLDRDSIQWIQPIIKKDTTVNCICVA